MGNNYCPKCGNGVDQVDKFCRSCGAELELAEVVNSRVYLEQPMETIHMCGLALTGNAVYNHDTSIPFAQITSLSVELTEWGQDTAKITYFVLMLAIIFGIGTFILFVLIFSTNVTTLVSGSVSFICSIIAWFSFRALFFQQYKFQHALRVTTGGLNIWSEGRRNHGINELYQLKTEIERRIYM